MPETGRFRIAGLRLRVRWDDAAAFAGLAERWRTYEDPDGAAPADLSFEVATDPALPGLPASAGDDSVRPRVTETPSGFAFERSDCRARAETGARWTLEVRCTSSPFALENCCRVAMSLRLPALGGLLLHASGAVRGGRALVFPAPSGTGKTTMARLCGPPLLGDEIVAVRPDPAGAGLVALSTPFGGEMRPVRAAAAPLLAILFLQQAERHALATEDRAALLRRLLRNTIGFPASQDDRRRHLEAAEGLLSRAPRAAVLSFAEDPSVVAFLDGQVAAWAQDGPGAGRGA